jgi:hypothetical protein
MGSPLPPSAGRPPRARRARWPLALLGVAAGLLIASRLASIATVAANWDELALLHRADRTLESGVFESGGRPGLAVLLLLPFVAGCSDEIEVVRQARVLWLLLTLAYLGGVAAWVAQLQRDPQRRAGDAAWALALLAAVPAFLEWSIQVRSDQLALAFGAWGGAALLASRRRPGLAALAGLLLGCGYLASQKALYVAALAGLLAVGAVVLQRDLRPRREAVRALLCAAAAVAVLAAFRALLALLFDVPERHASQQPVTARTLGRGLSIFDYYRRTLGYDQYAAMLPTLVPHGVLLAALTWASVATWRRKGGDGPRLALAWCVLGAGIAVAGVHAAAFFYFWMTLGLFPAIGFALARGSLEALLPSRRARVLCATALGLALALPALAQAGFLLVDTQAVQRETFAFVHRNLERTDAGFHPESGLFCQLGGPPIQTHFSQTIYRRFAGRSREANTAKMIGTFREEPVKFIVQSFRLNQFPLELRRFWAENYQPYRASVFLAGRKLAGGPGERVDFELIVTGRYRWLPFEEPRAIRIDGERMAPADTLELAAGSHAAHFGEGAGAGILVLAVQDPPGPAPLAFYKDY